MSRKPPRKQSGQAKRPRRFDGLLAKDIAGQAGELGETEKALRAQVARGTIPYRRLGGRIIFLPDEIREFLRQLPGVTAEQALANVAARRADLGAAREGAR
jgi:hypothetical protein